MVGESLNALPGPDGQPGFAGLPGIRGYDGAKGNTGYRVVQFCSFTDTYSTLSTYSRIFSLVNKIVLAKLVKSIFWGFKNMLFGAKKGEELVKQN